MARGFQDKQSIVGIDVDIWERQEGETPAEYNLFTQYRDTGLTGNKRPSRTAFAKDVGHQTSYIYQVSHVWKWQKRLEAYDAEMEKRHRSTLEKRRVAVEDRTFEKTMQLFVRLHDSVDAIMEAVTDVALEEGAKVIAAKGLDDAVEVRVKVVLDADALKSLASANKTLVDTLRTAVGLPTSISSGSLNVKRELTEVEQFILARTKHLTDGENQDND